MSMTATRTPSDAYVYGADENLRLSEVDPIHALVRAIVARAFWDSIGRVGTSGAMTPSRRVSIMLDAQRFFKDGRCQHLVESIGCDVEKLGSLGIEVE